MIRKIIKIDEEKCNGCGLCADACHEGAIVIENNKAKLIKDDYCDGLGNCLPVCPTEAISFEEREAAAYDDEAVKKRQAELAGKKMPHGGCPGSNAHAINRPIHKEMNENRTEVTNPPMSSELMQWPVQIKLVPVNAPYFNQANLLIAADCTAYAYANFHNDYMKNHITIIGCPKLDEGNYADKLTEIIKNNDIKKLTVARMEVPCCGGIVNAVKEALKNSGKVIPWQIVTISTNGTILE